MVPTLTTGLLGGITTRSASVIASMTPGPGEASSSPTTTTASAGDLGVEPHPVLLEVHDPPPAGAVGVGDGDVGLDPVVGHRQQSQTVAGTGESQRRHSASVTSESG